MSMRKSIPAKHVEPIRVQCLVIFCLLLELLEGHQTVTVILESLLVTDPRVLVTIFHLLLQNFSGVSHPLGRIHHVHVAVRVTRFARKRSAETVTHGRRPLLTLFRGNHDNTVGRPRTVQRRGGSVFQHVDLLDILRVQPRDGITQQVHKVQVIQLGGIHVHRILLDDTVHHPQRLLGTQHGGRTADTQPRGGTHLS